MKAFHFYLKTTIIRRINAIVFRNELKKIARLIEKIESFRNTSKRSKRKWLMISKRIVFNFMNAIASTLLTHHRERFRTIVEAKVVIEENFENEIEIEIEKILIFINHSKNHRIAIKSNTETAKWKVITHVIARSFSKTIKKKRMINRRNFRRSNSNRLKEDYQTYVHHDNFISEYRTKDDSSYDRLWRNVQFHFSNEDQEMKSARIRQRIIRVEDAERHSFKCYETHVLKIEMIDSSKREIRIKQIIIVANMTKIDMILNFFWLKKLNLDIDWLSVIMRWRIENAKKSQKRTHVIIVAIDTNIANSSTKSDAQNKLSVEDNTNLQDSNIAIINQLIFEMYCKRENVQVYIFDCKNLHDIEYTMYELIIEAMMKSS
jgi:hypothetical protein